MSENNYLNESVTRGINDDDDKDETNIQLVVHIALNLVNRFVPEGHMGQSIQEWTK